MNMVTNWIKQVRKRIGEGKNKAVTPRLDFPFFLKTVVKQGSFQKKHK